MKSLLSLLLALPLAIFAQKTTPKSKPVLFLYGTVSDFERFGGGTAINFPVGKAALLGIGIDAFGVTEDAGPAVPVTLDIKGFVPTKKGLKPFIGLGAGYNFYNNVYRYPNYGRLETTGGIALSAKAGMFLRSAKTNFGPYLALGIKSLGFSSSSTLGSREEISTNDEFFNIELGINF